MLILCIKSYYKIIKFAALLIKNKNIMMSIKFNQFFGLLILIGLSACFSTCYLVRTCDAEGAPNCGELKLTFESSLGVKTSNQIIDSLTFKFNSVLKKFDSRDSNKITFIGLSGCSGGKNLKIFDKNNVLIAEANLEFGDFETKIGCGCWPALQRVIGVKKIQDGNGICHVSTIVIID
jgi:hypothetical protein